MVDVSEKKITLRTATARATVALPIELFEAVRSGEIFTKKGAVIATAIVAGVQAAKRTGDLIPFCHPLGLERCDFETRFDTENQQLIIECTTALHGKTGVEMEALTAVSVAALTVYDMCKAVSKGIAIREILLLKKTGGKSDWTV